MDTGGCISVSVYMCAHVCVHAHSVRAHMCASGCVCVHVCVSGCVCVHMCVSVHMRV